MCVEMKKIRMKKTEELRHQEAYSKLWDELCNKEDMTNKRSIIFQTHFHPLKLRTNPSCFYPLKSRAVLGSSTDVCRICKSKQIVVLELHDVKL